MRLSHHRTVSTVRDDQLRGTSGTPCRKKLFGHRKVAFTGATEDRAGLFEVADDGTLRDYCGSMNSTVAGSRAVHSEFEPSHATRR